MPGSGSRRPARADSRWGRSHPARPKPSRRPRRFSPRALGRLARAGEGRRFAEASWGTSSSSQTPHPRLRPQKSVGLERSFCLGRRTPGEAGLGGARGARDSASTRTTGRSAAASRRAPCSSSTSSTCRASGWRGIRWPRRGWAPASRRARAPKRRCPGGHRSAARVPGERTRDARSLARAGRCSGRSHGRDPGAVRSTAPDRAARKRLFV